MNSIRFSGKRIAGSPRKMQLLFADYKDEKEITFHLLKLPTPIRCAEP